MQEDKKINVDIDLQLFAEEPTNNEEPKENTTNEEKKVVENEKNDYNENKVEEEKPKSLEEEVSQVRDNKYLAKVIVDLQEENKAMKEMLSEISRKLDVKTNSFTDSGIKTDNDDDESKYYFDETKLPKIY